MIEFEGQVAIVTGGRRGLGRAHSPDQAAADMLLSQMPVGKFVTPEAMVGPAVFLASAASDYVTGILLPVDGGYLAQ